LEDLLLNKTHTIHLKPEGEICNRLKQGTRVKVKKEKATGPTSPGEAVKRKAGFISPLASETISNCFIWQIKNPGRVTVRGFIY